MGGIEDGRVTISSDDDIVTVREVARRAASAVGFVSTDLTLITSALSEIAKNIVMYAGRGEVVITTLDDGTRRGIELVGHDDGPGIVDLDRALEDGYSSASGLGIGLPGARRIMDEFDVDSGPGRGTTVTMRKWVSAATEPDG